MGHYNYTIRETGYFYKDGNWYRGVGLKQPHDQSMPQSSRVNFVDGGYVNKGGVWYKRVGVDAE